MAEEKKFEYGDESFADIQLLRYRLNGFEELTVQQKILVYFLSEATLWGRDITFSQFGKYNLIIRRLLEAVYVNCKLDRNSRDFKAFTVYLKRLWFSNGIYHHYGCDKFTPEFSVEFLRTAIDDVSSDLLPLAKGQTKDELCDELFPVIFQPNVLPKRVNQNAGEDLVQTSACNFYEGVTQKEVEQYYASMKQPDDDTPVSYGLNSTLVKDSTGIHELTWRKGGLYGEYIEKIIYWLVKAMDVAENENQRKVISLLIKYYQSGSLSDFDEYSIEWVKSLDGRVDFVNGFIEVYGDPLCLKGTWEGIVEYKDLIATRRTKLISDHAQWFEDHSPVDPKFRKSEVKGVTANVICAAMLGGDEYPSSAIGINLPNADWIRARYGSKSVTIGNLTEAYNKSAHGNGFLEEFVIDKQTFDMIEKYGDICDDLHTDLHECLGHGSGRLLPNTDPDALKSYGNTIEEARADLFGLYYLADNKLVELGLTPDNEAYKSQYYTYLMNGLMTQLIRIQPGKQIEEAHMRNRSLIAHWVLEQARIHSDAEHAPAVKLIVRDGKTFVQINDYTELRTLFGELLADIQRIKSEGDYISARNLVEKYAVKVNPTLHSEVLARYKRLHLAPYKGFINPVLIPVLNSNGDIEDIRVDYTESYTSQMLRYSRYYSLCDISQS
jgi:dipeptidyl-peptidase-3